MDRRLQRALRLGHRPPPVGLPEAPRPTPIPPGPPVVQRNHAAIGTMIHHAPPPEPDPAIDPVNKGFYGARAILDSRRGGLKEKSGGIYDWDFAGLAQRIADMRERTGLPARSFPIVVNANRMISPGLEDAPKEYMDEEKEVFAISSVWGMDFKDADGDSAGYGPVLASWKRAVDHNLSGRRDRVALGDNAMALLRAHAKDLVAASRNDAIPHRGLRNLFFQDPWFMGELQFLERAADFVHIITLDSDADLGTGEVLDELAALAERYLAPEGGSEHAAGGLHITATDYVYARDDLFEWLAGLLDKVGRKKMEQRGFDAYPAEPGLTISYSSTIGKSARGYLAAGPFGPESTGDPRGGPFKGLVNSSQSVEGKNLRESWRRTFGDPEAPIHRTTAYANVRESEGQLRGHGPTMREIGLLYAAKRPIPVELIQSLISSDNYHSLTPDRNDPRKRDTQRGIVQQVTVILNRLLAESDFPADPRTLKAALNAALAGYMNG
ncbi:MAG TPA: hypothetical protein VIH93_13280 [Thermoanaerobaculia bacterium]